MSFSETDLNQDKTQSHQLNRLMGFFYHSFRMASFNWARVLWL